MPPNITVIVDQPFDWLGAILIPVAAVLVSSGIAILLAGAERRAARKDRKLVAAAETMKALTDLSRSASVNDQSASQAALNRFAEAVNVQATHMTKKELVVIRFVSFLVGTAVKQKGHEELSKAALFSVTALELWCRGELKPSEFETNLPPDPEKIWITHVDLSAWRSETGLS